MTEPFTGLGPELFMTGKLKVNGNLLFAARVPGFFDPVQA
jgi:putative sterol carrier protein